LTGHLIYHGSRPLVGGRHSTCRDGCEYLRDALCAVSCHVGKDGLSGVVVNVDDIAWKSNQLWAALCLQEGDVALIVLVVNNPWLWTVLAHF
jgi:hypothetical protein